jgi:hypothetical protein
MTVTLAPHFVPIERVLAAFLLVDVVLSGHLTLRHRREVDLRTVAGRVTVGWVPVWPLLLVGGALLLRSMSPCASRIAAIAAGRAMLA